MPAAKKFSPVFIGVSPAGVMWMAYRPEHVDIMRKRFDAMCAKFANKPGRHL